MMCIALDFSAFLKRNAAIGGLAALAGLTAAPLLRADGSLAASLLWLCLVAAALAVIALSAHLFFDAMLFRLMGSFPDEATGGHAVDDILARAGLRAAASDFRPLADRMAGTRRLLARQRIALAIFVALFAAFAFLPNAIPAAGGH